MRNIVQQCHNELSYACLYKFWRACKANRGEVHPGLQRRETRKVLCLESLWCFQEAGRLSQALLKTRLISLVQVSHSVVSDSLWPHGLQASLSITNSQSLLKLMSIESVMPSNHLILSCPLLVLLSIFPSIRVFSNESVLCIRWPKYWSFSFNISPFNEYSGLISIRKKKKRQQALNWSIHANPIQQTESIIVLAFPKNSLTPRNQEYPDQHGLGNLPDKFYPFPIRKLTF